MTEAAVNDIATSLRVNPSWKAACDYSGVNESTLNGWKQRAKAYETKLARPEELVDLAARRLYARGRALWDDHDFYGAVRTLERLERHLERDLDYPYWQAKQRWIRARARGELELVGIIRDAARKGDWRAALALLRMGWPDRYTERLEVTGADGGALHVELADAEARARAALDSLEARRARDG